MSACYTGDVGPVTDCENWAMNGNATAFPAQAARGIAARSLPPRRHWVGLFAVVALAGFAQGQEAGRQATADDVALPRDVADGFADRTPLAASGQPFTAALQHAFSQSPDRLADAAQRHADGRRGVLSSATGEAVGDFSTTHDLLRFPDVNRGRPVQLAGVVRDVGKQELGERPTTVVRLVPSDATGGLAAVLLPDDVEPPEKGDRIRVTGLFLKIAALPADDDSTMSAAVVAAPAFDREDRSPGVLPDRSLWSVVEHRTLGVRATESGLYYRLLHDAASARPDALQTAAAEQVAERRQANRQLAGREPFPVFVDMFKNPTAYEGRPVTLNGYAREIRKYPAGQNAAGLETLYEAWIYTDDSQGNPAVVVAADVTGDIPLGDDLQVPVRVTGYFFKIYGYEARDTTRVAPMILAGHLDVLPEPVMEGPPWWLLAILAGVFAALIFWLATSYWRTRRRAPGFVTSDEAPDFTNINEKTE